MKILLDECVPQRLRNHLPGHECQSARYAGFGGLENGDLLTAAEAAKFDVLLTVRLLPRWLPVGCHRHGGYRGNREGSWLDGLLKCDGKRASYKPFAR